MSSTMDEQHVLNNLASNSRLYCIFIIISQMPFHKHEVLNMMKLVVLFWDDDMYRSEMLLKMFFSPFMLMHNLQSKPQGLPPP